MGIEFFKEVGAKTQFEMMNILIRIIRLWRGGPLLMFCEGFPDIASIFAHCKNVLGVVSQFKGLIDGLIWASRV